MKFRTEIEIPSRSPISITHDDGIVMLGSCFTDNIGEILSHDGFDVVHNPMGPLYNAASISRAVHLALHPATLNIESDTEGSYHCVDFASKYVSDSQQSLQERVNADLRSLGEKIRAASTIILTLGTAYVFRHKSGNIVGNCHKFPAQCFQREFMEIEEIVSQLKSVLNILPADKKVIFTVSPIRHTADGLHGNQASKARLLLAVDAVTDNERTHYFPSYEIMLDDLRDYRYYTADMKHPSAVAVDYIYEIFSAYYFSKQTIERANASRKEYLRSVHRQNIN